MFIISSTSQMANYTAGFVNESHAYATMQTTDMAEEADELSALHFQPACIARNSKNSTCSISSNGSTSGGLRRSISSMHGSLDSYHHQQQTAEASGTKKTANCSHSSPKSGGCIVEAKQVEMDFACLISNNEQLPLQLTVTAPNGESSSTTFERYGQTHQFCPVEEGCGHGNWEVKIEGKGAKRITKRENVYLDGVGSLFFTIGENMNIRLSSQEFLRLPSASQCCSNTKKAATLR